MKEIKERAELYFNENGYPVRWRNGELQWVKNGEWVKSGYHTRFIAGEPCVLDSKTSEFVCAPKRERPYNLTTGQMIDTIKEGEKYEFAGSKDWPEIARHVHLHDRALRWPDGETVHLAHELLECKWRKVEAE